MIRKAPRKVLGAPEVRWEVCASWGTDVEVLEVYASTEKGALAAAAALLETDYQSGGALLQHTLRRFG